VQSQYVVIYDSGEILVTVKIFSHSDEQSVTRHN